VNGTSWRRSERAHQGDALSKLLKSLFFSCPREKLPARHVVCCQELRQPSVPPLFAPFLGFDDVEPAMTRDLKRQRQRKRLLVASVGVATVSFMALHTGCDDSDAQLTNVANLLVPLDGSIDFAFAPDANAPPIPTSGNLLPLPQDSGPKDAGHDALVVSGNLVAPPPADAAADAASDAAADAASDAAPSDGSAAHDARVDTGIPASGNLLPPIGPR
jgi:hypothetical protein